MHSKGRLSLLQIEMHTAQGALRVRILNKVDGQESTAMNIAWHYDLVVTTFSRLSTEWGKEKKKQRSIFDQVRNLARHKLLVVNVRSSRYSQNESMPSETAMNMPWHCDLMGTTF